MNGEEIKAVRQKILMSQKQFANLLGITDNFISLLEKGKYSVTKSIELAVNYIDKNADKILEIARDQETILRMRRVETKHFSNISGDKIEEIKKLLLGKVN